MKACSNLKMNDGLSPTFLGLRRYKTHLFLIRPYKVQTSLFHADFEFRSLHDTIVGFEGSRY